MRKLKNLEERIVLEPEKVMKDYQITQKDLDNYNARFDDYNDSPRFQAIRGLLNRESLAYAYQAQKIRSMSPEELSKYLSAHVNEDKLFIETDDGDWWIDWDYVNKGY